MKPKFLNTDEGSGKIVVEALNKIFKIIRNDGWAEIDYCDYKIIEITDFRELETQLKIIDEEIQEGSEWIAD